MKFREYQKYVNDIIESNQITDLNKYFIRYKENFDCIVMMRFDFNSYEWKLEPFETISNETMTFDLMKMIQKHEEINPLLSFLIKEHSYMISFQIPDYSGNYNIYPYLDEGDVDIKIINEYDKNNKLVKDTCFNKEKMMMPLQDIEDIDHLYRILEKLDSISSGYTGVEIIDYENNKLISIDSHSSMIMKTEYEQISIHGPENFCFELIKRNEMTIYNEIYEEELIQKCSDHVLNEVLKSVFTVLVDGMNLANKPLSDKCLFMIQRMPQEIKDLFNVSLSILMESKLSPSLIIWRQIVERDIDYDTILNAYETLK